MAEIKNLRFDVRVARDYSEPFCTLLVLIIKGEIDGKTYGTSLSLACANGEVPAAEFTRAVEMLQETMRQIAEELQKGGDGDG